MPATRADLLGAVADAHAFYIARAASSWVPHHLNRRNLYAQMEPAGIGYAPKGWTVTTDHLRHHGHSDQVLVEAGLSRRASNGNIVDFFRDRLMIPLTAGTQELVGFIGRCPENAGEAVPKYLNSPQTPVFSKHDVLYGLADDSERISRGALPIIVEGPTDRLAIAQGARNFAVVGLAPCGTALTAPQVKGLLAVVGKRPIAVALDPDPAGRAATIRAWDLLTAAGATNLLHIALPDGRDPAELLRNGRADRLRDAITSHRPLVFAVADQRISEARPDPDNTAQRVAIATHIAKTDLRHVPGTLIGAYVVHLAQRLNLDTSTMTAIATEAVSAGLTRRGIDPAHVHARMCAAAGAGAAATDAPARTRRVSPTPAIRAFRENAMGVNFAER